MTGKPKISTSLREHSEALDYDEHKQLVNDLDDAADLIDSLWETLVEFAKEVNRNAEEIQAECRRAGVKQ